MNNPSSPIFDIIKQASAAQQAAANPQYSVWVSASAGTGKTRILTQRVLRLLLQNVPAHRILCITFTKAAAAEMNSRIQEELIFWANADDVALTKALTTLTGLSPNEMQLKKARRLFAEVLESPGGMRIQTIHSFCQQILGRFPVEAGIPPNFSVMDEMESQKLLQEARNTIITRADLGQRGHKEYADLAEAVDILLGDGSEKELTDLLNKATGLRNEILNLIRKTSKDKIKQYLGELLDIDPKTSLDDIAAAYLNGLALRYGDLKELMEAFKEKGGKTEGNLWPIMDDFLAFPEKQKEKLENWKSVFFTAQGEQRKLTRFPTNAVKEAMPAAVDIISAEQEALNIFTEKQAAWRTLNRSMALIHLSGAVLRCWQQYKIEKLLLDYDDLIDKTAFLLDSEEKAGASHWVHYKLDEGIDHILVDEAQDTSPNQWRIITKLADVFFEGDGRLMQNQRSLFVVGDYKQSIYSFQGARPEIFRKTQTKYQELGAQKIDLFTNFRSTPPILEFTDAVFNHSLPTSITNNHAKNGVLHTDEENLHHQAVRLGQRGCVEIWPLIAASEKQKAEFSFPAQLHDEPAITEKMAENVALRIKQLLQEKYFLSSQKRACEPRDFLILVRNRHPLVQPLLKALKKQEIPIAGSDRLDILEHIAVQDLLALARFMLQPKDDYSLACVLRSPLFKIDEDALFTLSYGRSGNLFEALKAKQTENAYFKEAFDGLASLRQIVDFRTPFEFFSEVLAKGGSENMYKRLGDEAKDALNEFLDFCLHWEKRNPPLLETFMRAIDAGTMTIKREYENNESFNAVRIMTAHSSKGLQAPIVILPDTHIRPTKSTNEIEIYPYKDVEIPLWTKGKQRPPIMQAAKEEQQTEQLKENHRLLYVALTRAEDYLIIGGWEKSQTEKEKDHPYSWYEHMEYARQHLPFKKASHIRLPHCEEGLIYSLSYGEIPSDDNIIPPANIGSPSFTLPDYFYTLPSDESQPPKPLTPGIIHDEDMPPRSPLDSVDLKNMFNRGLIIHKLFELLPQLSSEKRYKAAQDYLKRNIWKLPLAKQNQILKEVFSILEHPEFSDIFSPQALSEVPISGIIDNNVISGRIDRMLITDEEIFIIDFKSNRNPPPAANAVPKVYIKQLALYKRLLSELWPHKTIRSALLWTDNCCLMFMDDFL